MNVQQVTTVLQVQAHQHNAQLVHTILKPSVKHQQIASFVIQANIVMHSVKQIQLVFVIQDFGVQEVLQSRIKIQSLLE